MLKVTSEAAYVLKAAREGVTTPTAGLRIKRAGTDNDPEPDNAVTRKAPTILRARFDWPKVSPR